MEKLSEKNKLQFKLVRKPFELSAYFVVYVISLSSIAYSTVYFQEEFSDGDKWHERWISSEQPGQNWGSFILTAGKFYGHPETNKGIQTFKDGEKYGISTKFPPFSNRGKTLVIQYTVKHEQNLKCGGGYVKLFNCSLQPRVLDENTPYLLMFGPDKCIPTTLKIHVIFNYKGKYLEFKKQIHYKDDNFTHLYTLILKHDNTYAVKIDNKDAANGKLKDDWDFMPPGEILDYRAKKSKDWDDRRFIDDPTEVKPKDWDQLQYIPETLSTRPDGWDDSLDGQWEPPLIENSDFKGAWKPGRIPNPKYRDRPKITNPEFIDDLELHKFEEICAVGFDIYQTDSGTIFDNILITDDVDYAEQHSWKIWGSLRDGEKTMARKLLKQEEKGHSEL